MIFAPAGWGGASPGLSWWRTGTFSLKAMMPRPGRQNIMLCLSACWSQEGGIERVARSLIKFFSDNKDLFNTRVLILTDSAVEISRQLQKHADFNRLKITGFSKNKLNFIWNYLKEICSCKYDIIIFSHLNLSILGLQAKLLGRDYAIFLHGIEVWRQLSYLQRRAVSSGKLLIANSEFTLRKAEIWHNGRLNAQVCHLGIDSQPSDPTLAQEIREILGERPAVLLVARMSQTDGYSKGHRELLEALLLVKDKLPEILLLIVGRGNLRDSLEKEVSRKGLSANVIFTGFVSDNLLSILYETTQVLAMPSRGEGFGLVYLEAMAHGKPCIGSTVDAAGEVILDGETGFLVDPDKAADLAAKIVLLLTDPGLRNRFGQAGLARYGQFFTEERFHERFKQILLVEMGK
jgi:phosphatidyl-myo-inositol dimannoside synthase